MVTTRSRRGDRPPPELLEVGLTLPRRVKAELLEAAAGSARAEGVAPSEGSARAEGSARSAGRWVLAAAADHGSALQDALGQAEVRRRPRVDDATFVALALTSDERDELDELAVACGLNRSAFVTSVSRLALGEELEVVLAPLVEPG